MCIFVTDYQWYEQAANSIQMEFCDVLSLEIGAQWFDVALKVLLN